MLDVAVSYNRYKFLGYEFLTWLWFAMEKQPEALRETDPDLISLEVGNRIVLENHRNNTKESITIKGDQAGLEAIPVAEDKPDRLHRRWCGCRGRSEFNATDLLSTNRLLLSR